MKKNLHNSTNKASETASYHLFSTDDLTLRIIRIMDQEKNLSDALQKVCNAIYDVSDPEKTVSASIVFDGQTFCNQAFTETSVIVKNDFRLPENKKGFIELFLSDSSPAHFSGDQIDEAESALQIIVPLLVGLISKIQLEKLTFDMTERRKELQSINRTTEILKKGTSLSELLQEICSVLPEAMQFPAQTVARITYGNQSFTSSGFVETPWKMEQTFDTPDSKKGSIEI